MLMPCDIASKCSPCDPVLANLSSEGEDLFEYIGIEYTSQQPPLDPTIGSQWDKVGCVSVCISTISQEDADLCAARQQLFCNDDTWVDPPPDKKILNYCNTAQSCSSPCPDGLEFTITVPAGTFCALSQLQANQMAQSYACNQAKSRKICLSDLSPNESCLGSSYTGIITASGGFSRFDLNTWSLTAGALPDGLNLAQTQGRTLNITGTPTVTGTFNFTIRITASNGDFMQKSFTLCIIDIIQNTLPNGTQGNTYSQQLTATSCAQPQQSWQVSSGSLPPGLSLDEQTGIISGTPTTDGTYIFKIRFQDAAT